MAVGAIQERRALALAVGRAGVEAGEVVSLFVAPAMQSRGVGTRLLQEMEAVLGRTGARRAALSYAAPTTVSPALERVLQKRGWKIAERRMILAQLNRQTHAPAWTVQTAVPFFPLFVEGANRGRARPPWRPCARRSILPSGPSPRKPWSIFFAA